jgi:hypothetical protein
MPETADWQAFWEVIGREALRIWQEEQTQSEVTTDQQS